MKRFLPIVFLVVFVFSCQSSKENTTIPEEKEEIEPLENMDRPFKLEWKKIAHEIINRADLQPDEKVLLVAYPGDFDSLVVFLEEKIKERDAEYLGTFSVT